MRYDTPADTTLKDLLQTTANAMRRQRKIQWRTESLEPILDIMIDYCLDAATAGYNTCFIPYDIIKGHQSGEDIEGLSYNNFMERGIHEYFNKRNIENRIVYNGYEKGFQIQW